MTANEKILNFAMKYYYLYMNPQTTEAEVTDGFAEACRELGFSPVGNPYELLPDRRNAGYAFLSEEDTEEESSSGVFRSRKNDAVPSAATSTTPPMIPSAFLRMMCLP